MDDYKKNSLSLTGAVSLGTRVMIGAGIFALLGQVAELSGNLFPIVFIIGAIISGFSAYSYIKLSNTFPSAGGIAMYLQKEYGKTTFTAFAALLMAFSMVINESLVARTFGAYVMQQKGIKLITMVKLRKNLYRDPEYPLIYSQDSLLTEYKFTEMVSKNNLIKQFTNFCV